MFARILRASAATALVLTAVVTFANQHEQMDPQKVQEEWAKWAAPGPQHATLQKLAGKWTTASKWWMDPSQPPMETKGTAEYTVVFGGRFLQQKYASDMMGMPFEGLGMLGYDNFRKEFTSSWSDNMTTAIMTAKGPGNAAGTEITMTGTMDEPLTGERDKKFRQVMKIQGADTIVLEMYDTIPGKGEVKVFEITHKRVK